MKKKLEGTILALFSIFCAVGFSANVDALEMTANMTAAEVMEAVKNEEAIVIDGASKYTINGGLSVTDGRDLTIKNVTLDGEGTKDILVSLGNAGKVVIENVSFENYIKSGIYAEQLKSLVVSKSVFDASDTYKLGDASYTGNPEEDLIKRSAAGIDLNLGNQAKTIDVSSISITDNEFKNVEIKDKDLSSSTAGAIKLKIKNAANFVSMGTVTIKNNTFTNNTRDLVIGTLDPTAGTEAAKTADIEVLLVNNSTMKVFNFSTVDKTAKEITENYKINYYSNKEYKLDENLYYVIDDNNIDAFNETIAENVLNDDDILGFSIVSNGITLSFAKEDIDENFGASLEDFDIIIDSETTIEALKKYASDTVLFLEVTGEELFANKVTYTDNLGEAFDGKLFMYYYDETNGLQLLSNPVASKGAVSLTFDKTGNYVISTTDLLASTPSEEPIETPEVPQTFDNSTIYVALGLIGVAGIGAAVLYFKKKNLLN